ncbi:ethanolamine utilization protein, partial [bacterium]|nr:ethanolamine utilization protein [bacterium]
TWHIEWRETAGEFGARLAELELSSSRRKPLDELCSWQLIQRGEGDFRPELVFNSNLDFSIAPDLFGLFMNKREALQSLRKIVEVHHLCLNLTGLGIGKPDEACVGFKQKTCRGACAGKESVSMHSARLMAALAKLKLSPFPHPGPVALHELLDTRKKADFDPEIYRIVTRFLKAGKVRVFPVMVL